MTTGNAGQGADAPVLPVAGNPIPPHSDESLSATLVDPAQGPATMARWLWVAYPLGNAAYAMVLGAVLQVLLGRQIAGFGFGTDAAGVLGIVTSVGAVVGLVASPVLGLLSDKTRVKFLGRRNIWIFGCAIASGIAIIVTGLTTDPLTLSIVWAIAIWPLNGYVAALTTVLPERVPVRYRGTMSGISGTVGLFGTFVGIAIAGTADTAMTGYIIVAIILAVVGTLFAFTTKDVVAPVIDASVAAVKSKIPTFRTHPDFWWAFIGRFLTFFGYFIGTGMLLFILRDYIKVGDGSTEAAAGAIVQVSGLSTLFIMVASLVGGILADKFGRLKVFVMASSLIFVPGAIVAIAVPTFTGITVAMCIAGFGFGSYLAVDQALISRVISDVEDAGRDLGIFNIANGAPQVVTPVLAGLIISTIGYPPLFMVMIVFSILGAVAIMMVRSVR